MNLWAKHIRQLAFLPVALFFFSCEDEASLLGYKNPNTKFEVRYIEIPLESSVLLLDSQRTSHYLFTGETNKFLVGQYVDPKFGTVSSNAFSQFFTTTGTPISAAALPNAIFDSVSLQLGFDLYTYGSTDKTTTQQITVYELDEELSKGLLNYFNTTDVAIKPDPIGSQTFMVDPEKFKADLAILSDGNTSNDTLVTRKLLRIKLDPEFGQRIFNTAVAYANAPTVEKVFIDPTLFTAAFKGIVLKTDGADKIVGFDPSSLSSGIDIHFHNAADTTSFTLNFFNLVGFNQIKSDRSSSELAGLTEKYENFFPANDTRYIQGATSVFTKIDFSNFFAFADTVPNLVINSAQLVIENVEQSNYAPPTALTLRLLKSTNRFHIYDTAKLAPDRPQDERDITYYNPRDHARYPGSIVWDNGSIGENDYAFVALGDQNPYLAYSSSTKSFSGNYSLFFQQLTVVQPDKRRFDAALLYPIAPAKPATKTINRTTFPKTGIKLRIYYTKPTLPLN